MRKLDPSSAAVLGHFGNELRRYRDGASMSRDALGRECWVSGSLVKAIERADRIPSQDFTQRAEKALGLGTGGPLARLWEEAVWPIVSRQSHPSYFGPFAELEAKATMLREFDPVAVPGLLQTEDYARAVLRKTRPDYSEEQVEEFVAARMERQQAVLDGDEPPTLVALINEPALSCPVGGREVMSAQLDALIEAAQRPNIIVQVVAPTSSDAGAGLAGMFIIASLNDNGGDVAYFESAATGQLVDRADDVAACAVAFEVAKADALPREQSLELIREHKKEFEKP